MKIIKQIGGLWIIATLMVLIFTYTNQAIRPAMWSKLLGLQIVSFIFSLFLVFNFRKTSLSIPKSPQIILYIVFILSLLPSCLYAINTALAWSEYAKIFSIFLIFILALFITKQNDTKLYFLKGLVIFILLSLGFAVIQLLAVYSNILPSQWIIIMQEWFGNIPTSEDPHQKTYFIKSIFAHRNLFAQILLLSLPFIGFTAYQQKGIWRYLAILTTLIILLAIVFLFVRSVWLIGIISLFIGIFLLILSSGFRFLRNKSSFIILAIILLLVGISFGIIKSNRSIKQTFIKQTDWVSNSSYGSANERLVMWKSTIPMIKDNPIKGIGPNNWGIVIPKYLKQELRDVSHGNYTNFQRPHNDYLQMMAEYGIISFLIFFILILLTVIILLKRLLKYQNQEEKLWLISLILFFIIYAGISFFSFPRERITHQLILSIALAFSIFPNKQNTISSQWTIEKPSIILVAVTLLWIPLIAHSTLILRSDINIKKAYEYRKKDDNKQFIFFKKAKHKFYNIDPNGTPIDWYLSYEYSSLGNIEMAEKHLKLSLSAHSYHKHSLNDLGTILGIKGENKQAKKLYKQALDISPYFVDANVNMAILCIQNTQFDTAWHYLSQCDTLNYHNYYKAALSEVIKQIGSELSNKIDPQDSLFAKTIERILQDPEWIWTCHKHAIDNNNSLMQQFVVEAVYVLLDIEGKINKETADYINNKYKIKN